MKVALESAIQQFWLSYLHALVQEREFALAAEVLRARRAGFSGKTTVILTQINEEQQLKSITLQMEQLSTENNQADKKAGQYEDATRASRQGGVRAKAGVFLQNTTKQVNFKKQKKQQHRLSMNFQPYVWLEGAGRCTQTNR